MLSFGKGKLAVFASLLLITLFFSAVAASAQEAPLVEVPRPVESFWESFFSTQATVPLNLFVVYDTSGCRTLYEGKCNVDAKVMFDCYADSAGACRCYTKTEAGKCGVSGGNCIDSDGGNNVLIKGTATAGTQSATDSCVSSSTIKEAFCVSGTVSWTVATKDYYCPASQTCQDGACKTAPSSAMCRDSDGGINPQIRGTVLWQGRATDEPFSDTCNSDTQIREFYCNGDAVESVARNCGSNERCVRDTGKPEAACVPVTTCTDTDGTNIYNKGSVTWGSQTVTDACATDSFVVENTCTNGVKTSTQQPCPSGYTCNSGACIQSTPPPSSTPPQGGGSGTGFEGAFCTDDTYCQSGLTCSGTAAQKSTGDGTCVISSGGTGTGSGTGGTGGDTGSQVCCQGVSLGKDVFYFKPSADQCKSRLSPPGAKDPVVEAAKCGIVGGGGTTCAVDETKQADGTCKKKEDGGAFNVPLGSIPSVKDKITEASAASLLKSVCLDDDQCKSKSCDDKKATIDYLDDVVKDRASAYDSSLGEIFNFGFQDPKIGQKVVTEGKVWEKDTLIVGVCVDKAEAFDASQFFKDNQAMIFVVGGLIVALMFYSAIKK